MSQRKIIDSKILEAILWYTIVITLVETIIDLIIIFQFILSGKFIEILLLMPSLFFESICLFFSFKLLKKNPVKYSVKFILLYWALQIFLFGIQGNTYCFTAGPEITIGVKNLWNFEGFSFFKIWSHEFSLYLNNDSDRTYIGINLIPLLISTALIYILRKKPQQIDVVNKN